jgi:DNA-directed RNA polymerase sigma subunit (sigma70/sigma32)
MKTKTTSQQKWIELKADKERYEALKKQIVVCNRKRLQKERAELLEVRAAAFLHDFPNWDKDKLLLSDTYRQILAVYYGLDGYNPQSLTTIAENLGVSRQCIQNKRDRAIKHLLKLQPPT